MLNGKPGSLAVRAAAEALADLAKENPAGQVHLPSPYLSMYFPAVACLSLSSNGPLYSDVMPAFLETPCDSSISSIAFGTITNKDTSMACRMRSVRLARFLGFSNSCAHAWTRHRWLLLW